MKKETLEYNVKMENGRVSFEKIDRVECKLRRKFQRAVFRRLIDSKDYAEAKDYLMSFQKERTHYSHFHKLIRDSMTSNGVDYLAQKSQKSVLKKLLRRFDASMEKRPDESNLGQWIGVEIECLIPKENMDLEMDEDGNADWLDKLREIFQLNKISNVTVKRDGSINEDDDTFGAEVTILFNRNDRSNLQATCDLLYEFGAKINKSCGLHVHLDCRDLTNKVGQISKQRVGVRAARLGRALPVLSQMVPKSRRNNEYCALGVSDYNGRRYFAINKTSLKKFGTIEVRLHSGTTDFSKINRWVDLLYAISHSKVKTKVTNVSQLVTATGIDEVLAAYVRSRIDAFSTPIPGEALERDAEDLELTRAA